LKMGEKSIRGESPVTIATHVNFFLTPWLIAAFVNLQLD
jgi:hypothetical protein